mmetsp:Transcript_21210/g.30358  ORF Transcript_21210/g.30358 Transcript_21210/m.30358 type:complete len:146 (-) Transcript_21210:139-576(-)|eukprot:CAMPEP_0201697248 /NCGR_PEP_ID=MMETSP0578-20130828/10218_1 /ASSEMBLY_ACC=CAM_ASM_000663 /TAXON_ID=267565 /ORGANISM="Skeletonema grethea, Strain CCMP 1804" /LENGTH=145 /DNA_ID=CAMNT_0048183363 /DNA_START=30 /DNA_END=467 /DNA_ORIENTATION=+
MAPIKVSATVAATPSTIWETCFAPMKWETWDPDVLEVKDVSSGCEDGCTCVFAMKDGNDIPITLSNVKKNESVDFSGGALGGLLSAEGKVLITVVDDATSKIDYSFELKGFLGAIVGVVKKKECVEGTEDGLANMVKLSEAAQKS